MAWNKVFQNWTWHNKDEALDTPLSAQNLQKINNAIDTIDSRVVETGGLIADSDGTTLIDNDGDIELYAHDNLIDIHTGGDIDIVSGSEITLEADSITIDADEVNAESLELNAGNLNINAPRGIVIDGDLGVTGGDIEVDGALSASGALSAGSASITGQMSAGTVSAPVLNGGVLSVGTANVSGQTSSVYFKSQAANSGGFASLAGGDGLTIKPGSESDTLIPAKITKSGAQFYKNGSTYYIQLGEQGVKADKVKIGSDGTISGDGDAVFNNFNIVKYLPSPAANLTGKIFLLTEEDVDYGHGDLWECRLVNNQYKWRLCESELKASVDNLTSAKADKVHNATAGHLAGLDAQGNLTDSGVSPTEDVTVEGNPITFDSPFEQDAKSVVVSVKPIQDLHGLPFPYVGGAYKNKLPLTVANLKSWNTSGTWSGNIYTYRNVTYEILTNSGNNVTAIKVNGYNETQQSSLVFGAGYATYTENYILNGCPANGSITTYFMRMRSNSSGDANDTGEGANFSPVDGRQYLPEIVIKAGYTASNLVFLPMLRLATESDATFAPYSNICPISGIDEVEIDVTGKNELQNTLTSGSGSSGFSRVVDDFGVVTIPKNQTASTTVLLQLNNQVPLPDDTYILNGCPANGASDKYLLRIYNATNENVIATDIGVGSTFTLSGGTGIGRVQIRVQSGFTITEDLVFKPMIRRATETDPAFEPYNPNSHTTIPLPSTLYDADVDVTEGDAPENDGFIDLGVLSWSARNDIKAGVFAAELSDYKFANDIVSKCEAYKFGGTVNSGSQMINKVNGEYCFLYSSGSTSRVIFILDETKLTMTGTEFKTAVTGIKLAYELATPTTISFTPADVELLEGTNVVTTNGESVKLTYGKSFAQAIDEIETAVAEKLNKSDVATIEGDTASKAYAVNDFMLRSDGLYKVTAPIASGASITSSNTTKTTIGAVLTALLNA